MQIWSMSKLWRWGSEACRNFENLVSCIHPAGGSGVQHWTCVVLNLHRCESADSFYTVSYRHEHSIHVVNKWHSFLLKHFVSWISPKSPLFLQDDKFTFIEGVKRSGKEMVFLVLLFGSCSFLPPLVAKPVGTVKVKHPQSCTVLIQGSTDHAIAQMKENVLSTFTFWQFPTSLFFDIVNFPGCHQGWLESCTELRGGWGEKTKCRQNCGFWLSWIGLKRGEESPDILLLPSWHVCLWEFHHSSLVGSAACRQLCLAPEHSRPRVLYRGWTRKKHAIF